MNPAIQFDGLRETGRSLGFLGSSKVALLRFYGDAGGKGDKTNIAVGGYVATMDQWDQFAALWNALLAEEGVKFFHRNRMEWPPLGEFANLGWTHDHQIELLNKLHKIIKENTIRGVGEAVRNKAFSQIVPPSIKRSHGGPYGWCVQLAVVEVGTWARKRNDWVHFIFELGDEGRAQIEAAILKLQATPEYREMFRIADVSFLPKDGPCSAVQLQAADFLAYEAYKEIENYLLGSPRKQRKSVQDLIRKNTDILYGWTDKALMNWLVRAQSCPDLISSLIVLGMRKPMQKRGS